MTKALLGCIADDFTGATDLANMLVDQARETARRTLCGQLKNLEHAASAARSAGIKVVIEPINPQRHSGIFSQPSRRRSGDLC